MKVFVQGLWHLGSVTAACCAAADVAWIAFDTRVDSYNMLPAACRGDGRVAYSCVGNSP